MLLAATVRVILFFTFNANNLSEIIPHIFAPDSDAKGYHQLAHNLLTYGNFTGNGSDYIFTFFTLDSARTPGYPCFLALIYSLFGTHPGWIIGFQILLNLMSIFLVFKIALQLAFSRSTALIAAFVFSIDIHTIMFIYELYSETLFVFLLLFSVFLFLKFRETGISGFLIFAGLLLGLLAMIRPISLYLPIIFLVVIIYHQKISNRMQFSKIAIFITVFLVTISIWYIRNYSVYGTYGFSTLPSKNLYLLNAVYTESNSKNKNATDIEREFIDNAIEKGISIDNNPFENARILKNLAVRYISENIYVFTKEHIQGMVNMYLSTGHRKILQRFGVDVSKGGKKYSPSDLNRLLTSKKNELICVFLLILYLIICYVFSLAGVVFLIKNKMIFHCILFTGIILYFTLLTGIAGCPRLKIPVVPFYSILCGYGIIISLNYFKKYC